jgi:mono/diheme cytochrome c family protein
MIVRPLLTALLLAIGSGPLLAGAPPYTVEAIEAGGVLYQRYCTECHGTDGRARLDVIADATDLTRPDAYRSGTSEEDLFRSINEGAGVAMPAFGWQLNGDRDVWLLVHYVRSLWPEDQRPAVVDK